MPNVSVILPNYNHTNYLALRIDSILNQTYLDYELIILDDCSVDSSREVIEKYRAHPKVSTIIYSESNSGSTFLQWDKGIQLAKGRYVWIAESDDFSDLEFLTRMVKGLQLSSTAGLAFCSSKIIDKDSIVTLSNYEYEAEVKSLLASSFKMSGKLFCERYLFYTCVIINASAVVFEKKLYENLSKEFQDYKVSGDWRMWIDMCYETDIYYLNEGLNYFRFHTNNVRSNKRSIMNTEAVSNLIASMKKTSSVFVKEKLRKQLFKHWCLEVSRDGEKFRFNKSLKMIIQISKHDPSFFSRLVRHLFRKAFRLQNSSIQDF